MPTKSSRKRLGFLKTSALLTGLFFTSLAFSEPLVNENITDQDIVAVLQLPMKERLMRLKEVKGIRDRLKALSFDRRQGLDVRWRSLTALANLGAKSYRWEVEEALKSRDWFMRNAGLLAIQHDDRDLAIRWSKKLLNDPALVVRTQAVKNLIDLKAEAREELWSGLFAKGNYHDSQSLWVRAYMAKALALVATPKDEKRFLRLLMDNDPRVQRSAVQGLERATGLKVSSPDEPISVQKQKWLSRLSSNQI